MIRALLVVLGGIGMLAVIVGLALISREGASMVAVSVAGGATVALAYIVDDKRQKRQAERETAETNRHIEALTKRPWAAGERLVVRGTAGRTTAMLTLLALLPAVLAWLALRGGQVDLVMLGIALLISAPVSFGMLRAAPALGRAGLVLDRDGLVTPFHGRIGWKDVNALTLRRWEQRGIEHWFLLVRLVEPRFERFHWTERVLARLRSGRRKNQVEVPLHKVSVSPEAVLAVARFLRRQATGEDHDWDPGLPDTYHEAVRRLLKRPSPDSGRYAAAMRDDPAAALREMEQTVADLEVAAGELARLAKRARRSRLWAIVLLVAMFAAGLYRLFRG